MRIAVGELATALGLQCRGDASVELIGMAPLATAQAGQLTFMASAKYRQTLLQTQATAVIVSEAFAADCPAPIILVSDNPYKSYAQASRWFDPAPTPVIGIHPSAVIDPSVKLGANVSIAANVVIAAHASIGANTVIGAGCVIGANSQLGENCLLHPRVVIYHGVSIGNHVLIHSGTVIGSDGFGFAPSKEGWIKIYQNGGVRIGSHVEIGANTCIDRGAIENTVIADGVIIDNLVHIAHNVSIGEQSAIAACVGIAGSTTMGKRCTVAGMVGIADHITIADDSHFTGMSTVMRSIEKPGVYSSGGILEDTRSWRRNAMRFHKLDEMHQRLKKLEQQLSLSADTTDND
jgi:UDP-3-O-[3-hydroxymyristoyl] glucosamine N-acyltransferase